MITSSDQLPLVIGADKATTATDIQVVNPYDGSTVARVAMGDAAQLDQAVSAAHEAFNKTRHQPPHERAELLLRIASEIQKNRDDLAATIIAEAGKPIVLAEAEVARAVITFTSAADAARRWPGEMLAAGAYAPGAGHIAISKRFPVGVVYGITPFNFPLNLVAHKIAPAIACGATIVIKPSPRTPISAIKLANIINACGAVPGQVNVVTCPNDLAMRLLNDERVKVVSFTGSVPIGWQIKQQARQKKVTLELGGNAAVIVHDDADIDSAVPMIATGAFAYAGQSCISVQRILVQQDIYGSFRDKLVRHINQNIKTGDPRSRDVLVGPMITKAAQDRVLSQIVNAEKHDATVLTGGQSFESCIQPTLMENVPRSHPFYAEEAFAPIAILIPYDTFEEAVQIVNDSRFGLQAGVFTRDLGRAIKAFHAIEAGSVLVNQVPTYRIDNLPYGGVKDSGVGREGVHWAIEDMTELRTLVIKQA